MRKNTLDKRENMRDLTKQVFFFKKKRFKIVFKTCLHQKKCFKQVCKQLFTTKCLNMF